MCLAQGHNAVTPEALEPAAPRSRVNLYIDPLKSYAQLFSVVFFIRSLFHQQLCGGGDSSKASLVAYLNLMTRNKHRCTKFNKILRLKFI